MIKLLTVSGQAEEINSRMRSVLWTIKYFSDYCIQARFYINQESTTRFVKIPVMAWETISRRENGSGEGQAREKRGKREREGRTHEWLDMVTSLELNFWMFIVISGTQTICSTNKIAHELERLNCEYNHVALEILRFRSYSLNTALTRRSTSDTNTGITGITGIMSEYRKIQYTTYAKT